jgi:hypothetical protein
LSRLRIGVLVALVALGVAVAIVIAVSPHWTPEQLRLEAEERLGEALRSEVQVGAVEIALGVGIHLEARDVRLWVGDDGPALVVETISIGIEPISLLLGELRPRRMVLEGATLRIEEDADGRWSPPFEFLGRDPADSARSIDEEILLGLNGLEEALRSTLDKPLIADSLRARNSRVTLSMAGNPDASGSGEPFVLHFDLEDGRLRHSRLSGDARIELSGVLASPEGPLGRIEWTTQRDRHEVVTAELIADSLALSAAQAWIQRWLPRAQISGGASGTASASWPTPGVAQVGIQLALTEFHAEAPEGENPLGEMNAPKVDVAIELGVEDERVEIDRLRIDAGDLSISLEGEISRPLAADADASLALHTREVHVAGLRTVLEWFPAETRDALATPTARVLAGRLAKFDVEGRGSIRAWAELFEGKRPPSELGLGGELEASDVSLAVGEEDLLERVAARARWSGDGLDVIEATGELDGSPLPVLHLKIDGVSNWVAADPSLRRISSGALPLSGIPLLWRLLADDDDDSDDERFRAALTLDIETLEYPLFLWPLVDVHAVVRAKQRGLNVLLTRGTWGGVPIAGSAEWIFEPQREAFVELTAELPRSLAQLPPPRHAWAQGRFVVHPIESSQWHRISASGGFSADAGTVRVHEVAVDLQPAGTLRASGSLDLSLEDGIPFQLSAELNGGDVADLSRQLDVLAGQATGSLSAWATLEGAVGPEGPVLADLTGAIQIEARDGEIWRKLPPVLSIALASESFNPFADRETIRYASVKTHLDIEDGRMHTESFVLDGPDLRVFADGKIDLAHPTHRVDADVALFLFRHLDQAIDLIPVLNMLLLGTDDNLVAAHFELSGPWDETEAKLVPLRSLSAGPASLVVEGIPNIVRKGFNAIGAIFEDDEEALDAASSEPKPFPWES